MVQDDSSHARSNIKKRLKPRRIRRHVVSIDETLVSASARVAPHRMTQPLIKGLSVPLCRPTIVAPPLGGQPFITRLDPQEVLQAELTDETLSSVLLGFAQMRPLGVKRVAFKRVPSDDVVVRLFQDLGHGIVHPVWILAHKASEPERFSVQQTFEQDPADDFSFQQKTEGALFCQYVERAVSSLMYRVSDKSNKEKLLACVRFLTGRELKQISLIDTEKAWQTILKAVCAKKPVFAMTKDNTSIKSKNRKLPLDSPVALLDAFEMSQERYLYLCATAYTQTQDMISPQDMTYREFLAEISAVYAIGI